MIARNKENRKSKLSDVRKARGFTQQQLSDASGVKVRMIQLYEQRQNDLSKARFEVVLSLAKALGCEIEVVLENGKVLSIAGNGCFRGKAYAEAEVTCPKRVVTSTVRAENGEMIPVKTDRPVRKEAIFEVMAKINGVVCPQNAEIGDVLIENVCDDANLVVSGE